MDELTPDEMKFIAAEIDRWNRRLPLQDRDRWQIHVIMQLDMQIEAYEIIYENRQSDIWFRNEEGKLEPAKRNIYYAPDYVHKKEGEKYEKSL